VIYQLDAVGKVSPSWRGDVASLTALTSGLRR
jgi:hypothetical protein